MQPFSAQAALTKPFRSAAMQGFLRLVSYKNNFA